MGIYLAFYNIHFVSSHTSYPIKLPDTLKFTIKFPDQL